MKYVWRLGWEVQGGPGSPANAVPPLTCFELVFQLFYVSLGELLMQIPWRSFLGTHLRLRRPDVLEFPFVFPGIPWQKSHHPRLKMFLLNFTLIFSLKEVKLINLYVYLGTLDLAPIRAN